MTFALLGRVVVVAGEEPRLAAVAAAAIEAGARVAVISRTLPADTPATVRFTSDPTDGDIWWRVGMHVEQHLGPLDGAATDAAAAEIVRGVVDSDFVRRGHGQVVVVTPADAVPAVVSRLCTRRAAPPRSPDAGQQP